MLSSSMRCSAAARRPLLSHLLASSGNTSSQRFAHTVRLIALEDLPHGKGYQGDVIHVKSGYARNFLVPQKKAVYATPQNFENLGFVDPDVETEGQRMARLERESSLSKKDEEFLKDADMLKRYLKNKVLKLWRVVDPNSVDALHPGYVTSYNLRQKLRKQLKIDLDKEELIHIIHSATATTAEPLVHSEITDNKAQSMVEDFAPPDAPCQTKIKRLGEYLAKISLPGGHSVPLRFVVQRRVP